MGRRKQRGGAAASFALNVEQVVEFWNNLLEEKPLLPFVIPLVLLLWAIERWLFSFSNWVPLAIAVWATVQATWGALLTGCRIHGKTELAAYAADRVFELGSVSPGMNVLLSNPYAAARRWEDAAKARKMLRDRGVKKETGLSWVEEGNRVHTFAAGDTCHVRTKEIYQKLEELVEDMKKAGYVPDTSFVLREVDVDEKNWTIKRSNLGIT